MEVLSVSGIHSRISEQARNIANLAEQIPDRTVKLHLIGVALGLLGLVERFDEGGGSGRSSPS